MQIRVCRYKNVGVAGYAEAFMHVQSDLQTSEWYSYFENDVSSIICIKKGYSRKNILCNADRGTRTLTKSPPADFESAASAIPPHPHLTQDIS